MRSGLNILTTLTRIEIAKALISRKGDRAMGIVNQAGNVAFKVFTAGLGVATIYLTATFSVNVYRGLAWHNDQKKLNEAGGSSDPSDVQAK